MLICPKCGFVAEHDSAGNIVCASQSCNWSGYIGEEINKNDSNSYSSPILRYYFVEYIEEDSELYQANCIYDLIEKILKQEGGFTPFVEKCYRPFTKSSVSELMQFYNHFGSYIIKKISESDNLTVVYEKK